MEVQLTLFQAGRNFGLPSPLCSLAEAFSSARHFAPDHTLLESSLFWYSFLHSLSDLPSECTHLQGLGHLTYESAVLLWKKKKRRERMLWKEVSCGKSNHKSYKGSLHHLCNFSDMRANMHQDRVCGFAHDHTARTSTNTSPGHSQRTNRGHDSGAALLRRKTCCFCLHGLWHLSELSVSHLGYQTTLRVNLIIN